jgi:phospholipid transport system substrate-binding protein
MKGSIKAMRISTALMTVLCVAGLSAMPAMAQAKKAAPAAAKTQAKGTQTEKAKTYIDRLGREALDTIAQTKSGKLTNVQAKAKFGKLLNESFDTPTIARFTLGRYWRVATPAQQKEFSGLIDDIIVSQYADRILNAADGTYSITGASAINATDYAVLMQVKPVGETPIDFAWRVRETKGQMKVIDLAVEGISMSITHRSDYATVIERNGGNVQALIDALKKKL